MNRKEEIKSKGFGMNLCTDTSELPTLDRRTLDFNKVKIGVKTLEDAVLTNAGDLKRARPDLADKQNVLRAIDRYDLVVMREISDFFFRTNGIYQRLCKYMANLYCYDWMVTPYINEDKCIGCGACREISLNDFAINLDRYLGPVIHSRVIEVNHESCVNCYLCEENCPTGAIELVDNEVVLDNDKCIRCTVCTHHCPVGALKRIELE